MLEEIRKNDVVILEFFSRSCAPCFAIRRKILEWTEGKDVRFLEFEVEENRELAASFEVFTAPTVICYVKGKMTVRESGYFGMEEVFRKLERYIGMM